MASWHLAPTLVTLRTEINRLFPLRDKTSDGTLGNATHAATVSDHNPDDDRCVCAIDVDEDLEGSQATAYPRFNSGKPAKAALVDQLLRLAKAGKLPQLHYVIYEQVIYQRKNRFAGRPYSGVNAHQHHVHVSVEHDDQLKNSTKTWGLTAPTPAAPQQAPTPAPTPGPAPAGPVMDLSDLLASIAAGAHSELVAQLQTALKTHGFAPGVADGYWGPKTKAAVRAAQIKLCDAVGSGADGIPGRRSLTALGFEVKA